MDTTITEKDKKLLIVLSCLLMLVLFGMFGVKPLVTKGMKLSEKAEEKEIEKQVMAEKIQNHDTIKVQLQQSKDEIKEKAQGMYPYMASNEIDNIVTKLCVAQGLQVDGMKIDIAKEPMWITPFVNSKMALQLKKDSSPKDEGEEVENTDNSSTQNKPAGATVQTRKIYVGEVTLDVSGGQAAIMNLNTQIGLDESMSISEIMVQKTNENGVTRANLKLNIYMYKEAENK